MKNTFCAALIVTTACLCACSTEPVDSQKRVTFESLQSAGQQMCQKNATSTCQPQENADNTQRNKKDSAPAGQ
jgi:hypothetical protein